MKNILITGCNRGLGLGLIKQLVEKGKATKIIATCRNLVQAKELHDISKQTDNVHILELDVQNVDSFPQFTSKIEEIVGDDGLNVLFNNAGFSPKSTRINMVTSEQLMQTFAVNTVAPILLSKNLLPLLRKAADKNQDKPIGCSKAAIINMSSILGSISLNTDGGLYPYKCSKAALNMATKSLSIDLYRYSILVTCIHPGWVKTDMGGRNAPMNVEESVSRLVELLGNLNAQHNGGFYQWNGEQLAW